MTKPFFYRITAADFLAAVVTVPEVDRAAWVLSLALELDSGDGVLAKTSYGIETIKNTKESMGKNRKVWESTRTNADRRSRFSPEYKEWRLSVYERDDYTCQDCGDVGGKLNAHHILKYSEYESERLNIDNGITLCEKCHKLVHYGVKDAN